VIGQTVTTTQIIVSAFAVLIGALMVPLSSGVRSVLLTALVALTALTAVGGGEQYLLSFFRSCQAPVGALNA
jgi:hypothetical protein